MARTFTKRIGRILKTTGVSIALLASGALPALADVSIGTNISTSAGGTISSAGLLTGTLGLTVTGAAVSLNASSNFDMNLGTGTSTGDITLGGGAAGQLVSVNSDDWDISTSGAMTGIGAITADGLLTGTGGLTLTGATAIAIGNNLSTVAVDSSSWDVSTAGVASGLTGLTSTGNVTVSGAQVLGASPLVFEGLTDNDITTIFAITNPTTTNKTITFPDASITVNAAADLSGATLATGVTASSLTSVGTLTALTVSGAVLANGAVTLGDAVTDNITVTGAVQGANALFFDGATDDAIEIIFAIPDPVTTDKTITFPNASITVNAAADLSGATLATGVTASSLTSVGTLTSLAAGAITTTGTLTFSGVGTDITTGSTEDLTIAPNSTGKIVLTVGSTTGNALTLTAAALTTGAGVLSTTTNTAVADAAAGISANLFNVTFAQGTAAQTLGGGFTGLLLNFNSNPTIPGNTESMMVLRNQVTANITDNALAVGLLIDNADTNVGGSTVLTDALRITNSGAIAAGITTAINIASTTVVTDLSLQNGETIDNDTDGAFMFGRNTSGPVTITAKDDDANAGISILSGGTGALVLDSNSTGAISLGTSANAKVITIGNVTVGTDVTINAGALGTAGDGVRINGRETFTTNAAAKACADAACAPSVTEILDGKFFTAATSADKTFTLPTAAGATGLVQGLPGTVAVGDVFSFVISNGGTAGSVVITAGTGATIEGDSKVLFMTTKVAYCRVTSVVANSETITCY